MQVFSISIILRVFEHLEFERKANTDPVKLPSYNIYKRYLKNSKSVLQLSLLLIWQQWIISDSKICQFHFPCLWAHCATGLLQHTSQLCRQVVYLEMIPGGTAQSRLHTE